MRTAVLSAEPRAAEAAREILDAGGNAIDATLAATLAGACLASPASLLGSCVLVVGGTGHGEHCVDGRARAPGLGVRRKSVPAVVHPSWSGVVPGLIEAVLVAHQRFGSVSWSTIVRAATRAATAETTDPGLLLRARFIEALRRTGSEALESSGLHAAIVEHAGVTMGGRFTRDDLLVNVADVLALSRRRSSGHEVLIVPDEVSALRDRESAVGIPPPPRVPLRAELAADAHGGMSVALYAVAPAAAALDDVGGLALAALDLVPAKGVPRRRAGSRVPMEATCALLARAGRVWGAVAASGTGNLQRALDASIESRLGGSGHSERIDDGTLVRWLIRDDDGPTVRAL